MQKGTDSFSEPFKSAIEKVKNLERENEYIGAFIFGSVARNEHTEKSDLDIVVITKHDNQCKNFNHPQIKGLKLDINFESIKQHKKRIQESFRDGKIKPMLMESIILFDKTGKLSQLKKDLRNTKPKTFSKSEYPLIRFLILHADDKAKRNLDSDVHTAHLALNINLNDILKFHYKLNNKWWVSNKRILGDLDIWDSLLATKIRHFVSTQNIKSKYKIWKNIIEHVSKPLGGVESLHETNCKCISCRKFMKDLLN